MDQARGTVVLAHGAGAGMDSPFMEDAARALAAESIRVVRFEFPYMREHRESGRGTRPDPPKVLEDTWLRVVEELGRPSGLVIGGKSMGGRIAGYTLSRVIRLVFLEDGDHSFKPRKSSGRTYEQNLEAAVREIVAFTTGLTSA